MLTCRSGRWCLAVDQQNRVLISTDPAHSAASWRLAPGGPGRHLWKHGLDRSGRDLVSASLACASATQPGSWRRQTIAQPSQNG